MTTLLQVLCNNPKKYAVVEPEGRIMGQKCVDIVIRFVKCVLIHHYLFCYLLLLIEL